MSIQYGWNVPLKSIHQWRHRWQQKWCFWFLFCDLDFVKWPWPLTFAGLHCQIIRHNVRTISIIHSKTFSILTTVLCALKVPEAIPTKPPYLALNIPLLILLIHVYLRKYLTEINKVYWYNPTPNVIKCCRLSMDYCFILLRSDVSRSTLHTTSRKLLSEMSKARGSSHVQTTSSSNIKDTWVFTGCQGSCRKVIFLPVWHSVHRARVYGVRARESLSRVGRGLIPKGGL